MSLKPNHEKRLPVIHSYQVELSERTRLEHDDLIECIHRLEAALASPAPGRERVWANRAASELSEVEKSLQRHIASAEGERGLFAELDLALGSVPTRVEKLRLDHARLLQKIRQLRSDLERNGDLPDFARFQSATRKSGPKRT